MGRFEVGNEAAVGNRGGGRPRKLLRDITVSDAPRVWDELTRVAFDDTHPLYRRYGFEALRTLAQFTFPRPQAVLLEASDDNRTSTTIVHLAQVAAARLAERERDAREHGACDACGGSGLAGKPDVAPERSLRQLRG